MINFVLDAGAVIKLAKAEMLENLATNAKCVTTKQVFDEVLKGKEKLYEDAFIAEKLVDEGKLKVIKTNNESFKNFGRGESSILLTVTEKKFDVIITDDLKFITELERQAIPFINTTEVITLLKIKKKISKETALNALNKIRFLVKEENYDKAKQLVEGEIK